MKTLMTASFHFPSTFSISCSQSGDLSQLLKGSWDDKQCRFHDLIFIFSLHGIFVLLKINLEEVKCIKSKPG